jgi:hypothetical protein
VSKVCMLVLSKNEINQYYYFFQNAIQTLAYHFLRDQDGLIPTI